MILRCSVLAQQLCLALALDRIPSAPRQQKEAEAKQALDQIVQKLNSLEEWFTEAQRRGASIQQ